tara:strand:+ start:217 stop:480 length:264 start_codon:yes stop_codon:yes gene_type:complete
MKITKHLLLCLTLLLSLSLSSCTKKDDDNCYCGEIVEKLPIEYWDSNPGVPIYLVSVESCDGRVNSWNNESKWKADNLGDYWCPFTD